MGTARSTSGLLVALWATLAFPLGSKAQQKAAPTDTDLKAAYCLGALNYSLQALGPTLPERERAAAEPNAPPIAKALVESFHLIQSNRERVRIYVAARSLQVDLVMIALAIKQGEDDTSQYSNNVLPAYARPEVSKRTGACADLSWLPF